MIKIRYYYTPRYWFTEIAEARSKIYSDHEGCLRKIPWNVSVIKRKAKAASVGFSLGDVDN